MSPSPGRTTRRLARVVALFLGACAAGLVLLVLGSAPAEAAPHGPTQSDPSLADLLRPAHDLIGGDLNPFGNVDLSSEVVPLEDPAHVVDSLNGSGALQGSTKVIESTVGTAEGVVGATTEAPRTLLEAAGSATGAREVTEAVLPSRLTPVAQPPHGSGTEQGQPGPDSAPTGAPSSALAGANTGPVGLYGPGAPPAGAGETSWLRPTYGFGGPATPVDPPAGAAGGPYSTIALLHGATAKSSAHAGASADTTGGNHHLAGPVPVDAALTPLALFFLAGQPRRPRRSPVFPPLVPPG